MTTRQRRIATYLQDCNALGVVVGLRDIARRIGVSHTTAAREVASMVERGEIEIVKLSAGSCATRYRVIDTEGA